MKWLPETQRKALKARRMRTRDRRRAQYGQPLVTTRQRIKAWASMLLVDHGFFRYIYLNKHRVGQEAVRMAQPGPNHIHSAVRQDGVKTVINLRGGKEFGSHPLEREACAQAGVAYEEVVLRSREAPAPETLAEVKALLERVEYPILFHCKSGADRAGLMSALYLMFHEGAPVEEARAQLSLRFGHVRQAKTGVLDAFLDAFAEASQAAKARGEELDLLEWARSNAYDAKEMTKNFRQTGWGAVLVDWILRRE